MTQSTNTREQLLALLQADQPMRALLQALVQGKAFETARPMGKANRVRPLVVN